MTTNDPAHTERLTVALGTLRVGDRVRFDRQHHSYWWDIRDRDDRFIVATSQQPFQPAGVLCYTAVDLTGWLEKHYNGAGLGVVRSSLNTLGGGWDLTDDSVARILPALRAGEWELSHRRVIDVKHVEIMHSHQRAGATR